MLAAVLPLVLLALLMLGVALWPEPRPLLGLVVVALVLCGASCGPVVSGVDDPGPCFGTDAGAPVRYCLCPLPSGIYCACPVPDSGRCEPPRKVP